MVYAVAGARLPRSSHQPHGVTPPSQITCSRIYHANNHSGITPAAYSVTVPGTFTDRVASGAPVIPAAEHRNINQWRDLKHDHACSFCGDSRPFDDRTSVCTSG